MRIALGLEYDGVGYRGWQTQPGGGAIQDHLEAALAQIAAAPLAVVAAGRTDAGVHASQQIVHFDTDAARDDQAWIRGTNRHLPANIRVLWAKPVPEPFHARFSAVSRSYDYWLLNDPVSPGLWHGKAGWFHQSLEADVMHAAAQLLLGEQDFTSFRSSECQAKSPVRTLSRAEVRRLGPFIHFHFRANAFLHHMVRNLVGTLVYIGCQRQPQDWIQVVLNARDRALAAPTFGPEGLYLSRVDYDAKWNLPAPRQRQLWPI